ncbi:YibE/F family protein [Clostridium sp. 1001271B_151109_B4]|uniref:YibE/F family protein n=1 Tax=Clostridium sp. 1001271B_151109_B4 TaxID=2787148 RepID=UPI00325FD8AD
MKFNINNFLKRKFKDKNVIFSLICLVAIIVLLLIPTGFQKAIYTNAEGVKVKILEVNNDSIISSGLIQSGEQSATIKVLSGSFKGEIHEGVNLLSGSLETDKIFKAGDYAFALIERTSNDEFLFANLVDHYRLHLEVLLIGFFVVLLIIFSGSTGVRTIISFVFTLICILKVFVPMLLKGYHPIYLALIIGIVISTVTLILVGGFTKKAYSAIFGSIAASLITCVLAIFFGNLFNIHGSILQWSESLIYSGYQNLNLTLIYQAGIYLSCSGAILDLAIDISAAVEEVVDKKPDISRKEILLSGLNVGRSVVGSQTTTLLLAYMGSFIGVMMVYMAQGTPLMSILNTKFISSEIVQTFVGCIGLVIVSPLTSVICSIIYTPKHKL